MNQFGAKYMELSSFLYNPSGLKMLKQLRFSWGCAWGGQESHWNDNETDEPRNAVGLLQMYLNKTATIVTKGAFVMYLVHTLLPNFSAEFRRNYSTAIGMDKWEIKQN